MAAAAASSSSSSAADNRELVIVAKQVYLSEKGTFAPASLHIKGGKITAIG
jgi:hypothetical protein